MTTDPSARRRLMKAHKLRKPPAFRRVYENGSKAGDDHLLVFALPNDLGVTRVGLSVSKKHGSAVKRNRIKRRLREAFRLGRSDLPTGLDLILIPRPASGATLADYRRSLAGCVRRAVKRLPPREDGAIAGASEVGGQESEVRVRKSRSTPASGPPLSGERGQG